MLSDAVLRRLAAQVASVDGVVGVVLGGSRARGTHLPTSDVDLGVYYDGRPDVGALTELARRWSDADGDDVAVGEPGSWGPWVDAGAWLRVGGVPVDWILRDVSRVGAQVQRARRGAFAFHDQPGHPLGFLDVAYVGELVTGVVLADPSGRLGALRAEVGPFPDALADALSGLGWQARFLADVAGKGADRGDPAYVALCLARALTLAAHALHGRAGVWVTNEKGLVPGVAALAGRLRPPAQAQAATERLLSTFPARAAVVLGGLGASPGELHAAVDATRGLLLELEPLLAPGTPAP